MRLLISACLLGINCKYSGDNNAIADELLKELKNKYELVPVCPEAYGGLTTPRLPAEIRDGGVFAKDGTDVTTQFQKGAVESTKLAKMLECEKALLKLRSPSCGHGEVYDGTFTGKVVAGNGLTADMLLKAGIEVFGENEIEKLV